MKKLLILSGKGGTGKTTIACAFIKLFKAKAYADCDVGAPNLHLVCKQENEPKTSAFFGLQKAFIEENRCVSCGLCFDNCRFNAIKKDFLKYKVDCYACEGCAVCAFVCPYNAISMQDYVSGDLFLYSGESVFSTACLKAGGGNSGKLVAAVKKQLYTNAGKENFAIIDGSPGIGCPVIASLSGVDIVLIVAEPSVSGISDMERIVATAEGFGVKIAVCINKFDTNMDNTYKIEKYCKENYLFYVGRIPYDNNVLIATNKGISIVELLCISGEATKAIFDKTLKLLEDN